MCPPTISFLILQLRLWLISNQEKPLKVSVKNDCFWNFPYADLVLPEGHVEEGHPGGGVLAVQLRPLCVQALHDEVEGLPNQCHSCNKLVH